MAENIKPAYVIDCNLIVKLFIPEKDSEIASKLLKKAINKEINLYSPAIILIEFANVLTRYYRKNLLTENECIKVFITFTKITKEKIVNIISLSTEKTEILSLAVKHKLSYFDAEYLYLSNKLKFDLITYDQQLKRVISKDK